MPPVSTLRGTTMPFPLVFHGKMRFDRLTLRMESGSANDKKKVFHKGPTEERDSTRPESFEERERLNSLHNHGHEKLQGEGALYKQRWAGSVPATP